jgi:uroporphyrinogen-III decarboxylase
MLATKTSVMTSRERVLAAARGLPVDRVPVMYWLNPHATCRLVAEYQPGPDRAANWLARSLWNRFVRGGEFGAGEMARALPMLLEEYGNEHYVLALGADIAVLSSEVASPTNVVRSIHRENGQLRFRMSLGTTLGIGGIYAEPVVPAVRSALELADYQLPPITDRQFAAIGKFRKTHPDTCLLVEVMTFQQALMGYIMGMPDFMLALYDYPDEVSAFMGRLADWVVDIIWHAVRAGADIVYLQDDYGYTGRPLISMKMWEELTYPHLKRFINTAHEAGVPMMLHSCGYQMPFLEHYVQAGLDILQSFQPKAGNDFEAAYAQYGDRLTFATGIDTQQGESMSPQELREDILRYYHIGKRTGRHIFSMTHMLQYTMPMENMRAIFDTVREIQAGVHD